MKRLIASIAILLLITTYLQSCEKDDICSEETPTTPRLVVGFFENGGDNVPFGVANFKYWVPGINDTLGSASTVTEIALPLRTDQDEVTWALQYNAGNKSNIDLFTVKYTRTNTYVSRACGYKTTFTLDPATTGKPNPSVTDPDGKLFIEKEPEVVTPNIENENEVHVKIYL